MLVDSHCHLNFEDFGEDITPILQAAAEHGINTFLNIACRLEEIDPIIKLIETYPQILGTVGIHPHEAASTFEAIAPQSIYEVLKSYTLHPRIVGVGETGLDFYYNHSPKAEQEQSFRQQIELAIEMHLPVIVHTRDAEEDTIRILKDYQGQLTGVIHCFSGTQWLADQALALGFYISYSGIVTFPKAADLRETVKSVPKDRILLETDAPFLAPVPKRGKRNEPSFMIHTAELVASLKEMALEEIALQTTNNFYTLFNKALRSV
jgi:TatD DNase family protein